MGTGGIDFRRWLGLAGALCLAGSSACRTDDAGSGLRPEIRVPGDDVPPSFASGHRFGRWLEVTPELVARPALESACLLEQTGESEEAINVLGEALEEAGPCASLFEARGALYLAAGYPRAAAGDFQRALVLTPEEPRCWYALGHAYEALALWRQALETLEHAHALGEDGAEIHRSLAHVQHALGRVGLAARHYLFALARSEDRAAEALVAALMMSAGSAGADELRERLETCLGQRLSDDAWLLREVLRELPRDSAEQLGATLRALEVPPAELAVLARSQLRALELVDPDTSARARDELLAEQTGRERRVALEHCLFPQ